MDTKPFWYVAFGVVCGLFATGLLYLVTRPPQGMPVTLIEPPGPAPIIVHVLGSVAQPGVYQLPAGARVEDTIAAAGGARVDADLSSLNLAAILQDGTRLVVSSKLPSTPIPTQQSQKSGSPDDPRETPIPESDNLYSPPQLININSATLDELDTLPGIGPSIAQRIIDYRTANGDYAAIEDIQNVKGIGSATFEKLIELITVGP